MSRGLEILGGAKLQAPLVAKSPEALERVKQEMASKETPVGRSGAAYKIEVMFSRHRSSLAHKPSPAMVLVWESGTFFHGGGDRRMYWCGYRDCGVPVPSTALDSERAICPKCLRVSVLSEQHRTVLWNNAVETRQPTDEINRWPEVAGERLVNLTPNNLAALLEKTWIALGGSADVYVKYSPLELRYDPNHIGDVDKHLFKSRAARQPGIYTLDRILKDTSNGASLRSVFLAMLVA